MGYRIEKDSLGEVKVPIDKLWGAQTERAVHHFAIGNEIMPIAVIYAIAQIKKAAACSNCDCGVLPVEKKQLIAACCDEILEGKWDEHFPLLIWQTGSGTQTNMNVNEVIANRAEMIKNGEIVGTERFIHPNDDVNRSQSTNDVFPSAMRIAAISSIVHQLLPALDGLCEILKIKQKEFAEVVQIGRTHLMDATPLTVGQTLSGYCSQIEHDIDAIRSLMPQLMELPIGGTAVGTGLNTPDNYDVTVIKYLCKFTKLPFTLSANKFEAMSSHDSLVAMSGALKRTAVSLMKIANDFRLLGSGPRSGIGEFILPANEPGSSIMPGKVNPTQCEALAMVCAQVIGNDSAIAIGAMQGHLQLNVFMPLIIHNLLNSIYLLSDAVNSFHKFCVQGLEVNKERLQTNLNQSLMLVTALNPHIGYANAAKIAQYAYANNLTLKSAALQLELVSEEDYDRWVNPKKMCGKNID